MSGFPEKPGRLSVRQASHRVELPETVQARRFMMATVLEPRSRQKYDDFLDARLNRARQQVRFADLTVAALGLVALTFGFGLVMLLLDRWLELPVIVRQFALGSYL